MCKALQLIGISVDIVITTSPNEDDVKILSKGIIEFNHDKIPDLEPEDAEIKFFAFAKSESGRICGGIRALCFWNTMHIELLWLKEECRGLGVGAELLKKSENFAIQHGFEKAFVETTSWQAKPFYEASGYEHVATLPDRPKGHASHYLTKSLV